MFDSTKGNKAVTDKVEEASDTFAALFDELPPRQQLVVLEKANEMMSDPDSVTAFMSGSYAQNSAGQPAQQLGAGSSGAGSTPSPNDLQEALDTIMRAPGVSDGQKAAMTRIFFGGADHIRVEADGTPSELVSTRTERDNAKTAKKTAEDKLAEEQDENKSGSLAQRLKVAEAAVATPADMIRKDQVKPLADQARDAVNAVKGKLGSKPDGLDDAKAAVQEVVDAVS